MNASSPSPPVYQGAFENLAPPMVVQHIIELGFLSFHASVTFFIICQIFWRNSAFCRGFFYVYSAQSVVDCLSFLMQFTVTKLTFYGLLSTDIFGARRFIHFLVGFNIYSQEIYHMLIAINRYTAFCFIQRHSMIWSGRRLLIVLPCSTIIPLLFASARLFGVTSVVRGADGFNTVNTDATTNTVICALSAALTASTTLLCGFLEFRSFHLYRNLTLSMRKIYRDDFRLLIYAVLQFFIQCALTAFYLTMLAAGQEYVTLRAYALKGFTYANDFLCLSGSACLFLTSGVVRRAYLKFYFNFKRDDGSEMSFEQIGTRMSRGETTK